MADLLTNIGTFWTAALGWMTQIGNTIMATPYLQLMVVILPVSGYAVGSLKRMIRLG